MCIRDRLGAGTKTARSRSKPVPAKKAHRRMSPQARKNLVAKHLREMLEEKNRRAAQTPAWQQIAHRDHPAPMSPPQIPEAGEAAPLGERGPLATCLLYTSDAADERSSVDLGGRRIIKK